MLTQKHKTNADIINVSSSNSDSDINIITNKINPNVTNSIKKNVCIHCNKNFYSIYTLDRHYIICKSIQAKLEIEKNTLFKALINNTKYENNTIHITQTVLLQQSHNIPIPPKGIIYLIQPVELIGTNRYKIGFSSKCTLERCVTGYKKGSRYINIQECFEPSKLESKLKAEFKNKFRLIGGTEYFWGDERQMRKTFNELFELHDSVYEIFYTIPHVETIEANNSLLLSSEDTINPINITDISI